jgi:hypothetical protein
MDKWFICFPLYVIAVMIMMIVNSLLMWSDKWQPEFTSQNRRTHWMTTNKLMRMTEPGDMADDLHTYWLQLRLSDGGFGDEKKEKTVNLLYTGHKFLFHFNMVKSTKRAQILLFEKSCAFVCLLTFVRRFCFDLLVQRNFLRASWIC